MKHTWLKLLTSLLWSQKFRGLPDNDHRIVYICHLIFAKMGLENEPVSWLAATSFVTKYRYKIIVKNLVACGLFDANGRVNGFEDSQLTPDAYRKRRQREREKSRDGHADSHAGNPPDSRKQKADSSPAEKKEEPPTPKPKTARQASLAATSTAEAVIGRINDRYRLKRSATQTLVRAVEILLRAGHTADDIMLVVDHRLSNEEWFNPTRHGAESLIRREKFPSMLQIAQDARPRQITSTSIDEGGWEY